MTQPRRFVKEEASSRDETRVVLEVKLDEDDEKEREGAPTLETPEEPRNVPDEVPEDDVPEIEIPEVPVTMGSHLKPKGRDIDTSNVSVAPTLSAITSVLASRSGTIVGAPTHVPLAESEASLIAAQHNL